MLFPTIEFVLFALISLTIWLSIPSSQNSINLKIILLIIFNLFFYGFYKPEMVLYLLAWNTIIWLSGKYLKWRYVIIGFAILQLVFFKAVDAKFIHFSPIATPLGISFFTFQGLTYLFARMKLPARAPEQHIEQSWGWFKLLAFIGFFPTVLSGPILRAKMWDEQLHNPVILNKQRFNYALLLIALGTFYKLCFSSIFHDYVSLAFSNPQDESGMNLLIGMYAYTFELYHDFAGYSLMAIGIALLYGFHIPDNFKQPYLSLSIREFWQRWHISFSNWLRDYFYISLGGSRKGEKRHLINTMIVMLVCGAWHGLNTHYLVWGLMHGIAICFYHLIKGKIKIPKLLSWFITFNYVALAWIFFRATDLPNAISFITTLFTPSAWTSVDAKTCSVFILFIIAFIFQLCEKWILNDKRQYQWPMIFSVVFWATIFILILIVSPSGMPPFIYFSY